MPCAAQEVEAEGPEVLTRGPVHEAFAETVVFKPTAGLVVPKASPAPIDELPPDQRPEGANVSWIPGYWAWEDDGNEFLWVSGIWRNLPPGRQWVPGYWHDSDEEYQWISGYWADADAEEVEYLPEPPASVDAGPNVERPSANSIWISGSWSWNQSRYRWRPGYWDIAQRDWVWVPAHYVWTRRGYISVDGYWDYSVARRGVIFAPVRFRGDFYSRPDYHYRPSTVISLAVFTNHLFLRPVSRHYYFGDYYEPRYRRSGYYASHSYYSGGYGYDPIFAHQRWIHRDDDRWERRQAEDYRYYQENRDQRPPHTLAAIATFAARKDKGRPDGGRREDAAIAAPLAEFVSSKQSTMKFKTVDEAEKERFAGRGREIRNFRDQRRELGDKAADVPDKGTPGKVEPARVKLPKSPVIAKATDKTAEADTPPKRPDVRPPDETADVQPGDPAPKSVPGRGNKDGKGDQPKNRKGNAPGDDQPGKKPKVGPGDQPVPEPKGEPGSPPADPAKDPKDMPRRQPGVKPGEVLKPDQPDPKAGPKDIPGRQPKEPKKESKDSPKGQPKAEPQDPNPERKADDPAPPKRQPKVTPQDPKPEPKADSPNPPKRQPKADPPNSPGREPKADAQDPPPPQRQPKVEPPDPPKRQPKLEPQDPPKRQPKVEPLNPPKREPRIEPAREPKKAEPGRAESNKPPEPKGERSKDSKQKDKEKRPE